MKKIKPNGLQAKMAKKVIDGILLVALRMWDATPKDKPFDEFCTDLINDTPAEFYARPIAPIEEVKACL